MRVVVMSVSLLSLVACTALMSSTPVIRQVTMPETPDLVYRRAVQAMARLGGAVTHADAQSRVVSATVHNAVILTVVVVPASAGSTVEVTGTLLPNKVAFGTFDEVDQFVALLQ